MKARTKILIAGVAVGLLGARAGLADSLQIIVNEAGVGDYYNFNGGGWMALASGSGSWDTQNTTPGISNNNFVSNVGSPLGVSLTTLRTDIGQSSLSWAGSNENFLILTQAGQDPTSGTSAVSDLLTLDGAGALGSGILAYDAPTLSSTGVVTITGNPPSYGYTTGEIGSTGTYATYTPASPTAIDTVSGLTSDLLWNNATKTIKTDAELFYTISGAPSGYTGQVFGYSLNANSEGVGILQDANGTITTTIDFVEPSEITQNNATIVPLPASVWTTMTLLGLALATKFVRSRRRGSVLTA